MSLLPAYQHIGKAAPRKPKEEDVQLKHFLMEEKIQSFDDFSPEKVLQKKI